MSRPVDFSTALRLESEKFWRIYYSAMRALHAASGRTLDEPIRDRNLGTTVADHVRVFETFWRQQLALTLGVPEADVGPRKVRFRPHRSKAFDVCWPLKGEPRILISIKSMQNAYRNLTNRVEEALGDSAVLRIYNSNAVFGFFFFILNGNVASGVAEQGLSLRKTGPKGVAPFLELIEEGGDFFSLAGIETYRKTPAAKPVKPRQRLDSIKVAEQSLLDLLAAKHSKKASIHYDAIAFLPTRIKRMKDDDMASDAWQASITDVDERLSYEQFLARLIATASLRGLIKPAK